MPLPLAPAGSVHLADGVDFCEDSDGNGSVFLWGMAAWSWPAGDSVARRLAAVQLVGTGAARQRGVATAFGINENTLGRWRSEYATGGVAALIADRPGPRGPSKLTQAKRDEIASLRAEGTSMEAIADRVEVSLNSVSRALRPTTAATDLPANTSDNASLEPLARPLPRAAERQAARAGILTEAPPVICEGASLPSAGALLIVPALVATGLLDVMAALYTTGRAAFYGLRSLVLTIVFTCLLSEPRAEGLTRLDPVNLGRLLGLDRAPEVRTMRRRMHELARLGRADCLIDALARRHLDAHDEPRAIFYVDAHVRAYHGAAQVPKAHLARMRLSMGAAVDTWVCDANGDGVLVWSAAPGTSLAGELRRVCESIRDLLGPTARPTICFDRGGWSPKLFAELRGKGFHILTYRKAPAPVEPRRGFVSHRFSDDAGHVHEYLLSDRRVRIGYKLGRRSRYFACRQITRLDERSGHQTQVLTTREDPDPALLAHAMFSRWRQENFFGYLRAHYGLDALDSYEKIPDDPDRMVPNPARQEADRALREARRQLAAAEEAEGRASLGGRHPTGELLEAFADARAEVQRRAQQAKAIPTRVRLGELHPDAVRLAPERKRIHDAVRMATYNAESVLARLLGPHYARADDEARSLLREAFGTPADLEVVGNELHVRLSPLSAPRRSRAIGGLCEELTATKTTYPGTKLTLVYSVKDDP